MKTPPDIPGGALRRVCATAGVGFENPVFFSVVFFARFAP
jgi:hypothetical protein